MIGHLHCPHNKAYCVEYQTSLGTLKGIENSWDEVLPGSSCQWENQQHGRGHHCKIVLDAETLEEGTELELTLVHEDGTKAPDATLTKHGKKKSTMLIGVDPRDGRLGLSWTSVDQEGPRKWFAASSCKIHVAPASSITRCVKKPEDDGVSLYVPYGQKIVIPIRIEVLSAVKGAGDFSRYCVSCDATSPKSTKLNWTSPSILVEAKWLPAAPVREQNKRRFKSAHAGHCHSHGSHQTGSGQSKRPIDNLLSEPFAAIYASTLAIQQAANSVHTLHNPRHEVLDHAKMDGMLAKLKEAIQQYEYQKSTLGSREGSTKRMKTSAGFGMRCSNRMVHQNWPLQQQQKQQLLSSPPRNKRINGLAPLPPKLNLNSREPYSMVKLEGSKHAGSAMLNPFDLLATAASKKQLITHKKQGY